MSGNHRIMVVDDEVDLLRVVELSLKRCGFEVETFTNPYRALEYFKNNDSAFSLVLTDIRMPGMSGIELAKEIARLNPNIKIMLMTAYEFDDSFALQSGLTMIRHEDILKKPFRFNVICNGVRKVLQINR